MEFAENYVTNINEYRVEATNHNRQAKK